MIFDEYNFIYGKSGSGKTNVAIEILTILGNISIFFDCDGGSRSMSKYSKIKGSQITLISGNQVNTYETLLRNIKQLPTDGYNICVDGLGSIPGNSKEFISEIRKLTKGNRYFFTISTYSDKPFDNRGITKGNNFLVGGEYEDYSIMNIITKEKYNISDLKLIFRDKKINDILNEVG